jgi:hypothetical protein
MTKTGIIIITLAAALGTGAAHAESGAPGARGPADEPAAGELANTKYLAGTGATVPRPDLLPPDFEPPRLGRSSYDRDKRIERSICSNC